MLADASHDESPGIELKCRVGRKTMKKNLTQTAITLLGLGLVLPLIYTMRSASCSAQDAAAQGVDANVLFKKHCDTCHGKDGRAKTFKAKFNHARDLTDAKWQAEVSDERIFNSISNGKGKMPAWGKKLSEAQINELVAHVRKLKR
jgi:mono/diheme cytochrome c family protein